MPPRARKTAAAPPAESPEEPTLTETVPESAAQLPTGDAHPEVAAPASSAPELIPEPDAPVETPPSTPAEEWLPGEPCRTCFPAGPLPSAAAVGCDHGSWVRVRDGGN